MRMRPAEGVRVREGNRRLAACLVAVADGRAADHDKRTRRAKELRDESGALISVEVPVQVFDESDDEALLPYLGVRHIAGEQAWESYAKAAQGRGGCAESGGACGARPEENRKRAQLGRSDVRAGLGSCDSLSALGYSTRRRAAGLVAGRWPSIRCRGSTRRWASVR